MNRTHSLFNKTSCLIALFLSGIRRAEDAADTMYDILFDNDFESAMSLGGSKGCAYRVSRTALVNISHGCRQGLINEAYSKFIS